MRKKSKSLAGIAALALGLFFGPALSTAHAWSRSPRAVFHGRVGRVGTGFGRGRFFNGARFAPRPFVGRGFRGAFVGGVFRPFRTIRVFVYDPFPHWVFRRIYDDPYCYPY